MENDSNRKGVVGQPSNNRSPKPAIRPRPLMVEHQPSIESKCRSESTSSSIGIRGGMVLENNYNSFTTESFFADNLLDNHFTLDPAVLERSQNPSCDIPGMPMDQNSVLNQPAIYSNEDFIDPDLIDLSLDFDVKIPLNVFHRDNDTTGTGHPPITTNVGGGEKSPENNNKRRPRIRINDSQKHILVQWISSHDNPYPTKQDKVQLSQQTGLDLGQISSWFTRTRQRKLPRIDSRISPDIISPQQINRVEASSLLPVDNVTSQESWLRSTSVPIESKSTPKSYSSNQSSQSLPLHYTLRNIYQRRCHGVNVFDQDKLSLDVIPSAKEDIDTSISLEGTEPVRKWLHGISGVFYGKEFPKAAFIAEWLQGIPDGEVSSFSRPLLCPPETDKTPHDEGINRGRKDTLALDSKECEDLLPDATLNLMHAMTPESSSIAESNCQSISSAGSYMSFGSRRGRRQAFHPTSSHKSRRGSSFNNTYTPNTESEIQYGLGGHSYRGQPLESMDTRPSKRRRVESSSVSPTRRQQQYMDIKERKKYYCTFCRQGFGKAYAWKRHEESVHVPQKVWICAQHESKNTGNKCPLCEDTTVCSKTECPHKFQACWNKAKRHRMFFRKDSLKQHIRLVHCKGMDALRRYELVRAFRVDNWTENVSANDCDLTCYFCGFVNKSWDERAKHIITHFESGLTIDACLKPWTPYDF